MKAKPRPFVAAAIAAVALGAAFAAAAADNQAGIPLDPKDAPGPWTVQSQGSAICVVRLSGRKTAGGYGFSAEPRCGDAIPAGAAAWHPTADGMALTRADGADLIKFSRWSNSLFVSHRSSGTDLQLKRGMPGATPGTD
jgi:hypothetical protein